jgi:Mycothiol maleylpyruvate isomerase N-terminal domain
VSNLAGSQRVPLPRWRATRHCRVNSPSVARFQSASRFFADCVAAVPVERYGAPWSDEWSVLELIGHGNRANVLPVEYYERPVPVANPDYFWPENVAERGRQAARQLGDDPVAAVRAASDRALAMAGSAPDDAMVGTPFGERSLADFLRSRTAELVLHGLDLGTDIEVPADALVECGVSLMEMAVRKGYGLEVVRALSGRGTLPQGFNVY